MRVKISQSSAQRLKRGHTAAYEGPDCKESGAPASLNNDVADTKTEKNGIIHSNGTSVEAKIALEDVTSSSSGSVKEEESVTTDSLSEISKFESKPGVCAPPPPHAHRPPPP